MSNYTSLKSSISSTIKQNGNNEITGNVLQQSLISMVNSLGAGYQFMGVASISTDPGTPDQKVFYIAAPGTYPNFNNLEVPAATTGFFRWDTEWHLDTIATGVPDGSITSSKLANSSVTQEKLESSLVTKLLNTGYKFMGIASPSTNPGTPNQKVFYLASEGGAYNGFNLSIDSPGLYVFKYDNNQWVREVALTDTSMLEMAWVSEDGLYFIDSYMNVGVKIDSNGLESINSIKFREL